MEFLLAYQLSIMLMLSAVCCVIGFFTVLLKFNNKKTKWALFANEIFVFFLLLADRGSYLYRGRTDSVAYFMVRVCNFLVFFLVLATLAAFNSYILSILEESNSELGKPKRLFLAQFLIAVGMCLLVLDQFTNLYYTFDDMNYYQRGGGYIVSYIVPCTVLILHISTIVSNYNSLKPRIRVTLLVFPILVILTSIVQLFTYGISLNTLSSGIMTIVLFVVAISDINTSLQDVQTREIEMLKAQAQEMQEFFVQTVEALSGAIDAKDNYTRGHSSRVADYAVEIAKLAGKTPEEGNEIYFAALLHDVGKIGIPDAIINKNGILSFDEFRRIENHPIVGSQILESITSKPYISIGAKYHHERYDGKGYPEHLKGEQIPELARIIAVADAYDAMTSKRSYRDPIPQQKVREEIFMGMGSQFDPKFAKYMLYLIDMDCEYEMKEKTLKGQIDSSAVLKCMNFGETISNGILIAGNPTTIRFTAQAIEDDLWMPSFIIYDSLNGKASKNEKEMEDIDYYEFGTLHLNGVVEKTTIRESKTVCIKNQKTAPKNADINRCNYVVEAVRFKDHILVRINNEISQLEVTLALPDCIRYSYFAITGINCNISDFVVEKSNHYIKEDYIQRIADEISYIEGPSGDIPNFQINSFRMEHSKGIPISNGATVKFRFTSLPSARRVWHCPILIYFTSDDRTVYGPNYREYAVIRFNGESYSRDVECESEIDLIKTVFFDGWDEWKNNNRKGVDCTVEITKMEKGIKMTTECGGLQLNSITYMQEIPDNLMFALSGDNCAITNINISRNVIKEVYVDSLEGQKSLLAFSSVKN